MRIPRSTQVSAILWIAVVLLGAHLTTFTFRAVTEPSHGFVSHYAAARLLTEGAPVARFYDDDWFKEQVKRFEPTVTDLFGANLPTMSLLMVPLTIVEYDKARFLWTATNLFLVIVVSIWLVRSLDLGMVWSPAFLCFVFLYQPVYANLFHGQMYVFALVLLSLAWSAYRESNAGLLGTTLGTLLVTKTAAMMMWPLLLAQQRWRALMWGAATILVVVVASFPFIGTEAWESYTRKAGELPSSASLAVTAYQTQMSFFRHLLVYQHPRIGEPLVHLPLLGALLPWVGLIVILGLSSAVAYRVRAADLVFAAFVLITLILSPVSLDYHYVIALLPIAILLSHLRLRMRTLEGLILITGALFIAADVPYRSQRFVDGALAFLAYPKLYGAVLLWGLALACGLRRRTAPPTTTPPQGRNRSEPLVG